MRLSVSDIDTYLAYLDEDSELTLAQILARLRREEPRPAFLDAGNAFHKILERSSLGEVTRCELDGFKFRFDLDASIALPEIREMKGELEIMTSVGPVTLVGKVDGFDHAVRDYKLSSRFNPEKYLASYQWRCYLLMFNAWKFVYDVFVYDEKDILEMDGKKRGPNNMVIGTEYVIKDYHQLPLYSYDDMESDVLRTVDQFARFVAEYMPEKLQITNDWRSADYQSEPRLMAKTLRAA